MKSHSIYVEVLSKVLLDSNPYERRDCSLQRDIDYVRHRVEHEGISFITKVMPAFGKHILRCIEEGAFKPFSGFHTRRGRLLPEFLQGWTKLIFRVDGMLSPTMSPHDLQELVQICMLFYKLEGENSPFHQPTVDRFIANESALTRTSEEVLVDRSILALARELLARVFCGFDPLDIKPKHGPGNVATGEKGNRKYFFRRKYQRLHQKFPYYRYFSPSLSRVAFESGWYGRLVQMVNPIAKVKLVPKDSRGPRLISMEPLEIQWIQQGILRKLVPHIENCKILNGSVNFSDQTFNQRAALVSSRDKSLATVDLKDASDMISLALFRELFPKEIVDAFESCRSVATELPDGRVIPLRKFAPMGSALCFPVLALTVWSLSNAALRSVGLDYDSILVYGDDLVVPTNGLRIVERTLASAGLVVNTDKTYSKSHYRESCGVDAYDGVDITPIKVKSRFPIGRLDTSRLKSWLDISEAFFDKGYWETCQFIRDNLERTCGFNFPWTSSGNSLGFFCPSSEIAGSRNSLLYSKRWNSALQREEFKLPVLRPSFQPSAVNSNVRLLKGLLGLYREASESCLVASRSPCRLLARWCTP